MGRFSALRKTGTPQAQSVGQSVAPPPVLAPALEPSPATPLTFVPAHDQSLTQEQLQIPSPPITDAEEENAAQFATAPVEASVAQTVPPLPQPLMTARIGTGAASGPSASTQKRLDAKVRIHHRLLEEMNLAAMEELPIEKVWPQIHAMVAKFVVADRMAMTSTELTSFVDEIIDEMFGLGPIEPLLKDQTISDILINGHECVFVERRGLLEPADVHFRDEAHLLRIINRIVSGVGRRVDESQPMCDARLPDGSRVNVAIRPIAVDGPLVSIRKFSKRPLSLDRLVEVGALRPQMSEVLAAAVASRITLIVSGGTGSGKTTMLNALSSFISETERLITIEDAAELQLQQPHVARMETRPANIEGKGEIRQRELVKNALRMRPERIILGECRGEEAFDMLQAMNTGHEGSMATIHANAPREAVSRLEQMIGMAGLPMNQTSIRSQIAAAVRLIVQLSRLSDGSRRVTSIAEITGMEGDILQMQEIFKFVRTGVEPDGKIIGHFSATGIRPRFLQDLIARGINLPGSYFDPSKPL